MESRFWSRTMGLHRWLPLQSLWRLAYAPVTGCVYFSIGKISWVSFICLPYWFWSALGRNKCDALKAGVKASLFLCVNCIFKNAWMSADIDRSACRPCGIHRKSPWRVILSGGCSFPACLPDDIISVWLQRGVKATAGPQAPQTRRFTITPPAHVWQLKAPAVSSPQHYYDPVL